MKRLVLFCVFLIGCVPADSKSCEFCGKWSFDRFEYAGYITADCDGMAQSYYENTGVEINAANIILGGYDDDEKAQEILVKKDTDTTEKFYVANSDLIYIYSDGCKFYFQRAPSKETNTYGRDDFSIHGGW